MEIKETMVSFRIHLIEVKNFGRAIDPVKDIAAFFEVKKIVAEVKPDVKVNHPFTIYTLGRSPREQGVIRQCLPESVSP